MPRKASLYCSEDHFSSYLIRITASKYLINILNIYFLVLEAKFFKLLFWRVFIIEPSPYIQGLNSTIWNRFRHILSEKIPVPSQQKRCLINIHWYSCIVFTVDLEQFLLISVPGFINSWSRWKDTILFSMLSSWLCISALTEASKWYDCLCLFNSISYSMDRNWFREFWTRSWLMTYNCKKQSL